MPLDHQDHEGRYVNPRAQRRSVRHVLYPGGSGGVAANVDVAAADVVSVVNVPLTGLQTIDGVSLVAGQIVLAQHQTTPSQNGLYVVGSGAWNKASKFQPPIVGILHGSINLMTFWFLELADTYVKQPIPDGLIRYKKVGGTPIIPGCPLVPMWGGPGIDGSLNFELQSPADSTDPQTDNTPHFYTHVAFIDEPIGYSGPQFGYALYADRFGAATPGPGGAVGDSYGVMRGVVTFTSGTGAIATTESLFQGFGQPGAAALMRDFINSGVQGFTGFQGLAGPQGITGTTGSTGPQGNDGVRGPQGNDGTVGPQGLTGTTGTPGTNGSTGPQGFDGVDGPQGFDGADGFQGFQGDIGDDGPQGLTGYQGLTGPIGPQGFQGIQGPQGIDGAQGPQGFDGIDGAGFQGFQGDVGPQGFQGTGVQGFQGIQGPQGPQGPQGSNVVVVSAVAVANITLSGSQTVDGVASGTNMILVTAQTTAANNGVWIANTSTSWTQYSPLKAPAVFVAQGTVYASTAWINRPGTNTYNPLVGCYG